MTTDLEAEAKEMFFSYACNSFYMANDGVFEKYQAFGISEAREKEWRSEFIAHWVARLSTDDMTAVNWLRDADAAEALPDLLKMAGGGDSFAKGCFADAIWDIAQRNSIPASMSDDVARTSVSLWLAVENGPIEISESHIQSIRDIMANYRVDASSPEQYVQDKARRRLAKLDSNLH